jgi:hypothetical protein
VWDHRPSAAELLEHRLADGWQPTPTQLKGGARVLGYAACVVATHRLDDIG